MLDVSPPVFLVRKYLTRTIPGKIPRIFHLVMIPVTIVTIDDDTVLCDGVRYVYVLQFAASQLGIDVVTAV